MDLTLRREREREGLKAFFVQEPNPASVGEVIGEWYINAFCGHLRASPLCIRILCALGGATYWAKTHVCAVVRPTRPVSGTWG